MTPRHLYDEEGYWVAFVVGTEVFLRGGEWLGRLSGSNVIRDREGQLRGLMDEGGRLSLIDVIPFPQTLLESKASREAEQVG